MEKKFLGGCRRSPNPQKIENKKRKQFEKKILGGVENHPTPKSFKKRKRIEKKKFLGGV